MSQVPSGIPAVGDIPWGSHFCHFCGSSHDLADALIPYFRAGIEHNDRCLWVAAEPFGVEDARSALRVVVPDLDQRARTGQIEIVAHDEWYLRQGQLSPREVAADWVTRARSAVEDGFSGLRLTGSTFWLQSHSWQEFTEYEATVNEAFVSETIIALCSYSLDRCRPSDILDVVRNHQFALARRSGQWEVIEDASLKIARAELERLNRELEQRVAERTAELERAFADKETLLNELHHRVRNNLQVISGLVRLNLKRERISDPREALLDVATRIQAISLVHDTLYQTGETARVSLSDYLRSLCTALSDLRPEDGRVSVEIEADDVHVGMGLGVPIGMIVTELVTNAFKHAFPGDRGGRVLVKVQQGDDELLLIVADDGVGVLAGEQAEPKLGLGLVNNLVRQVQGTIQRSPEQGTRVTIRIPHRGRTHSRQRRRSHP